MDSKYFAGVIKIGDEIKNKDNRKSQMVNKLFKLVNKGQRVIIYEIGI